MADIHVAPDARTAPGPAVKVKRPGKSVSTVALLCGLGAPLCAAGGAWLANRGVLPPYGGFRIFTLSLPLAAIALLFSAFALFRARRGRNRAASRKAVLACTAAALTMGAVLGLAASGASYPLINDITTDLEDPPVFVAARRMQPDGDDMTYRRDMAAEQKRAYPAVKTRILPIPPDIAFERATEALANVRNLTVIDASQSDGRIEAVSTSRIFRFADDVIVRIRPEESGGSRIDVRSRSRDGKGDFGVNAHRIENLLSILH